MLSIDSLFLQYGSKVLFNDVNVSIATRDRIALVGSNGMGKSTLLKILNNITDFDSGTIHKPNYLTTGYLPQDAIVESSLSLFSEVESAFQDIISLREDLKAANALLETLDPTSEDYYDTLDSIGDIEYKLEFHEESKLKSKVESVLLGLGFSLDDMQRPCSQFSGGWQMRIALAKLLLQEPSLLLLDEPTNHLDLPSQRWVERYLQNYHGAMIIISHDRSFLDTLTSRTFHLSKGNLNLYEGNYSYYETESVHRKNIQLQAYKNQQKYLADQQRFIDRFRSKASKAKAVQSRIKQLEKVERIEIESEEKRMHFEFPPGPVSGHIVMELNNVCKSYDTLEVYKNLNLRIERGDRLAIVGVNGAGKSTLAKLLAEIEPLSSGSIDPGHNVKISYFAQDLATSLDPTITVLETIENAATSKQNTNFRSILGSFLFQGDDVFKKVKVLSGGERCRLALACMLVQRANFLILDEPTNHLDMASQAMLQDALKNYQGTVLIVSHNRAFLDPIVNKTLEVSKSGIRTFIGNVSEYLLKVEEEDNLAPKSPTSKKKTQAKPVFKKKSDKKAEAKMRKQIAELEAKIESLEAEKSSLETQMQDPEFFKTPEAKDAIDKHQKLEDTLNKTLAQWDNLTNQLNA